MRAMIKKAGVWLLCLMWVAALWPVPANAAAAVRTDQDVSLTIRYQHAGRPVQGVSFALFQIADMSAYGEYTLTQEFESYPICLDGLDSAAWKALAETLVGYIRRDRIQPLDTGSTGADGTLRFPNQKDRLTPGLYLVVAANYTEGNDTYITAPFLISLPDMDLEQNIWKYDVTVNPKYEREYNPPLPSGDETVNRRVLKIWKDDGTGRPDSVVVQLLKDDAVYDTVTLNAQNNWSYSWEKLPMRASDGQRVDWRVVEQEVSGYTVEVSQEGNTFLVTNTVVPKEPTTPATPPGQTNPPDNRPRLPQTGLLWWPVSLLVLAGIICLMIGFLRRGRENDA